MRTALIVLLLASITGCFPHNARGRKIAKWTEGATMVAGVLVLSQSKTGADCTAGPAGREEFNDCRFKAQIVGGVGLGMVLAGLVGFGITQITSGDGSEVNKPAPTPLASEEGSGHGPESDPDAPKPTLPGTASVKH